MQSPTDSKVEDWDKPLVCPIDPELLAECEACQ